MTLKLRGKISLSMVSIAIAIIILLSGINYTFSLSKFKSEFNRSMQKQTEKLAKDIDKWIVLEERSLTQIGNDITYFEDLKDRESVRKYLKKTTEENKSVLEYYIKMQNEPIIAQNLELEKVDHSTADWFLKGKTTKGVYIGQPYLDSDFNKMVVTMARPIIARDGTKGVLAADILIEELIQVVKSESIEGTDNLFILDAKGDFVTHTQTEYNPTGKKSINKRDAYNGELDDILPNTEVKISDRKIKTEDGLSRYYFLSTIGDTGWQMGYGIDDDYIDEVLNRTIYATLVATFLIIIISVLISNFISKYISRPIENSVNILNGLADLDLTVNVSESSLKRKDEIGEMAYAFNNIIEKLELFVDSLKESIDRNNNICMGTKENVELLFNLGEKTSATTEELSAGMEETAATSETILGSIEEIYALVTEFTKVVEGVSHISNDMQTHSVEISEEFIKAKNTSVEKYTEAKDNIEDAIKSAKNVEKINMLSEVITGIAGQTTLLSLNAAIEAARAGEAGRGFEVVASEIRILAEDSNKAAVEIKEITTLISNAIGKLVNDTKELINLVENSVMKDYDKFIIENDKTKANGQVLNTSVDNILDKSNNIKDNASKIASAIREITFTIEDSTKATVDIAEENMNMVNSINNIMLEVENNESVARDLENLVNLVKKSDDGLQNS